MVIKSSHYLPEFMSSLPPYHNVTILFYNTTCMMLQMMPQLRHNVTIVGHICPSSPLLGRHICPSSPVRVKAVTLGSILLYFNL